MGATRNVMLGQLIHKLREAAGHWVRTERLRTLLYEAAKVIDTLQDEVQCLERAVDARDAYAPEPAP